MEEITKEIFTDIYFETRKYPGWLSKLIDVGIDVEEEEYLSKLDDEFSSYDPEKEADEWEREVRRNGGPDIYFIESDEERLKEINKKIFDEYKNSWENVMKGVPYTYIRNYVHNVKNLEMIRNKIRAKTLYTKERMGYVSDQMISQAKKYPLENLISMKLNKGRMPCPFHGGEDNNFLIKEGYGYCFVCNEWADSIKWLMRIEGRTFKDAVEILCRR